MRYQSTTGLSSADLREIVARVWEVMTSAGEDLGRHILGLHRQVVITLTMLRNNTSQMFMADMMGVSQPTICRIYHRICFYLEKVLAFTGITLTEAVSQRYLVLVDGTYIPTGNRPASGRARENFSGKRRCQCLSIQVAATASGELLAVSDPVPGSRHDSAALTLCGWDKVLDHAHDQWIADVAYIATTAITPIKKRVGRERLDWEREFNRSVASLRAPIEHCISHLKNWKILATGYRGRLADLPRIIALVTRLELFRLGW